MPTSIKIGLGAVGAMLAAALLTAYGSVILYTVGGLLAVVPIIVIVLLATGSFKVIPESERWVIERLGWARTWNGAPRVKKPGLRLILWKIDTVRAMQSLQEQLRETPLQGEVWAGKIKTTLQGKYYFKIGHLTPDAGGKDFLKNAAGEYVIGDPSDEDVYNATYRFYPQSSNPAEGLDAFVVATQRDVASRIATPDFDKLEDSMLNINELVTKQINTAADAQRWGIVMTRHVLPVFKPADEKVQNALQDPLIQEKAGQAAALRSVGEKAARLNKEEAEKQARILQAEAERQEIILQAQGRKEEEILKAQAQAEASVNMNKVTIQLAAGLQEISKSFRGKMHPVAQFLGVLLSMAPGVDLIDALGERLRPPALPPSTAQSPGGQPPARTT